MGQIMEDTVPTRHSERWYPGTGGSVAVGNPIHQYTGARFKALAPQRGNPSPRRGRSTSATSSARHPTLPTEA